MNAIAHWLRRLFPAGGSLGARGEREAARYLKKQGYRILARNLRCQLGEIDVLAEHKKEGVIVVVEVKSAVSEEPPPEDHVNYAKQKKLTDLGYWVMRRFDLQDRSIRFDVIAVVWPAEQKKPTRLTHHVNAFESRV